MKISKQTELFWRELVLSPNKKARLLRHALFLLAWWLYFSVCEYLYQQPQKGLNVRPMYVTTGDFILLKTALMIFVYAMASYIFIYSVMPGLISGKWLKTTGIVITLVLSLFFAGYLLYWNIFPFIDSLFRPYKPNSFVTWFWPAVYLGLINPTKVLATAGIIKYVKYWWLKQQESEKFERELINSELALLKTQIQPGFLFNSLDSIHAYSQIASPLAPGMLLKLSELLSYMLYECDQPFVPLEDEIEMMKKYMSMEKIRLDKSPEMEVNVSGNLTGKYIPPFLLLPIIENSIEQLNTSTVQYWINIDISAEENNIHVTVAYGMDDSTGDHQSNTEVFANLQKRLNLLYPERYLLKISAEQEMQIVHIKLLSGESAQVPWSSGKNYQQEFLHQPI